MLTLGTVLSAMNKETKRTLSYSTLASTIGPSVLLFRVCYCPKSAIGPSLQLLLSLLLVRVCNCSESDIGPSLLLVRVCYCSESAIGPRLLLTGSLPIQSHWKHLKYTTQL